MRDAFGGITSLVIIVVFLVLVSGYLAFNVNYTKAFKVKNKIISLFEQYEGRCGAGDTSTSECDNEINEYITSVGYSAPSFSIDPHQACPTNASGTCTGKCQYGYCWVKVPAKRMSNSNIKDTKDRAYYKITTQINIDIPIINKIMPGLRIFQVSGDTKTIVTG